MSSEDQLEADWIGNKGEQRFAELCADARLVCNRTGRDRAGWDFIVEFPERGRMDRSLDSRKAPISCHVQVKTVRDSTASISLKLNMAERLAKEPKPTFILVLTVGEDLTYSKAFLIPLLGDRLASVLKRLRKEQAARGAVQLNKKKISFTPTESERIAITGEKLREAIEAHCGEDIHAYIQEKQRQLERLGFTGRPIALNVQFKGMTKDQLLDVMLGLGGKIPAEQIEVHETRFGIELPLQPLSSAMVSIVPNVASLGTITHRISEDKPPIVLTCEIFVTPVIGGVYRMRLRHPLFSFIFNVGESSGIRINFETPAEEMRCANKVWVDFWHLAAAFHSKLGVLEFQFGANQRAFELQLETLELTLHSQGSDPQSCIQVFSSLSAILERIGIATVPEFTYAEVMSESTNIVVLHEFMKGTQPTELKLADPETVSAPLLHPEMWIVVNVFRVGSQVIAYYATIVAQTIEIEGHRSMSFSDLLLKKIRLVEDDSGFDKFVEAAKSKERVEHALYLA